MLSYGMRSVIYLFTEVLWATVLQKNNAKLRGKFEDASLVHMQSKVPEKDHKIMRPDYTYGCKHRVFRQRLAGEYEQSKFYIHSSA